MGVRRTIARRSAPLPAGREEPTDLEPLFAIGVGAFALSTIAYLGSLYAPRTLPVRLAHILLALTVLLWTGLLVGWGLRGESGTRLYLGFSAWSLSGAYLFVVRRFSRFPLDSLGSFVSGLATVLAVLALVVAHPDSGLEGPLGDWLLRSHIGLAFLGITGFSFASAVSLLYLLQARMLKRKKGATLRRRLPPLDVMDRLALRGILFGFPFYTLSLLLGSAEALRVEDGAEIKAAYVLAVVSWLIYGGVLQARLTAGWRGRRAAILTVVGMVVTLVVVAQYSLGLA